MGEGTSPKRDASARPARRAERSHFGADVFGSEVTDKLVDATFLQISLEDQSHPFGFLLDDDKLAIFQLIAEGEGTAHPKPPALGGRDLVPDALGSDLPLELGKGQDRRMGRASNNGGIPLE